MWSPVERTALADAEVEYHDHVSPDDLGEVPGGRGARTPRAGAAVVIWTTTPWTIPANRAIAYNPDIAYARLSRSRRWRRTCRSSPGPSPATG